jgi:DNA-directed RNA polymerase subunit beta'
VTIAAPTRGIDVRAIVDGGEVVASLGERILGRTAAERRHRSVDGEVHCRRAATLIDEAEVEAIEKRRRRRR